ncbi:DUF2252 domain-containing protein [Gordonia sp. (in: high G+C Gram-positive bacteria)]|uniref:DUF2252 domain-containing protein n=1 Tax=Gordonia sp. (in: high G+C Gram-positive bacteria) TaxID=84139 RepID=UPI00260BBFFC|nr:DUF2252 domain-containing protein [Gordonia sp. (in: high G+C Gram-positive bacteria)]
MTSNAAPIGAEELAAGPDLASRRDPVDILAAQDATRIRALVPVRHERMGATPFTFYRGAAAVMAADLAATPDTGIYTQLCGDAHLSNFGLFLSPARRMVFDLNDFDETHRGPFEWDVKRLAASMVVAAQSNGATDKQAKRAARRAARAYRRTMAASSNKSAMACWYDHVDADEVIRDLGDQLDTASSDRMRRLLKKSRHRNSEQALSKLCVQDDTGVHIKSDPPLLVPASEIFVDTDAENLSAMFVNRFDAYRKTLPGYLERLLDQYAFVEAARKVVGVGSVGTRCWIALFAGRENQDPLFLQMKEAQESVLAPYTPGVQFRNQGHRVVFGQQLMQASSDILLGWLSAPVFQDGADGSGRAGAGISDFYVRQLRDGKGSVVIEEMPIERLTMYGELCGAVLAQAHARTSARGDIARYLDGLGKDFDKAIGKWSLAYSAINVADHTRMVESAGANGATAGDPS